MVKFDGGKTADGKIIDSRIPQISARNPLPASPRRSGQRLAILIAAAFLFPSSGCKSIRRGDGLRLPYQGRPEYAPPEMPLARKARLFQEQLDQGHISPLGVLIYKKDLTEQQAGRGLSHEAQGDTGIWEGILLAAESFRYAATRSTDALENARRGVKSLHMLQAVHGTPGLLARHIAPESDSHIRDRSHWHPAVSSMPGIIWRDDVSKDQYAGVIFGYGVAYDLLPDEEIRTQVRTDMTAIADFLIRNGYRLIDHDGKPTRYSGLNARIGPIPIGVQALISLAAIRVAHHVSGEPRFDAEYRRLARRRWPQATRSAKFQLFGRTNPNNDNMAFLSYHSLLQLETNAAIRRHYESSAARTWRHVGPEGNAFWTFIFLACGGRDELALEEARLQLRLFPATKRRYEVDHRGRQDIERAFFKGRGGVPRARYPLPINLRARSSFDWKDSPYALYSAMGSDGHVEYAPVDYLVAYWMGRYYGFIGAEI